MVPLAGDSGEAQQGSMAEKQSMGIAPDGGELVQTGRRSGRRKLVLGCLAGIGLVVLVLVILVSVIGLREWRSPSGKVVVETANGATELTMPLVLATPPAAPAIDLSNRVPQPPVLVAIPQIGVRADVYLMTDQPPQFPAAGWLFGSAMPGTPGNIVLYGAREGAAAVFPRLNELQPGDEVTVVADDIGYVYQITSVDEVDAGRTDLLLPSSEPVVTLITDAGEWDAAAERYTRRLVVRGRYIDARPWSGT